MGTGTVGTTARQYPYQMVHYLRKEVNYNDTGIASGVKMGTLPSGAQIVDVVANVVTTFNAGGTNVLTVGTNSTAYDNIAAAADINEGSATGQRTTTGIGLELTADADVYVKFTETAGAGSLATQGKAVLVVAYTLDNDG